MSVYNYIFLALTLFLLSSACKKDNSQLSNEVALKYVDIDPDTTWIDIDNDDIKDIILLDTIVEYGIPGDTLYLHVQYAKSLTPGISVSWGKDAYPVDEYLLKKDSVVDHSLVWEKSFLVWGPGPWMNYGHDPEYIGIRRVCGTDTLFGWIYKPDNFLEEYAIDTSASSPHLEVHAGCLKKY